MRIAVGKQHHTPSHQAHCGLVSSFHLTVATQNHVEYHHPAGTGLKDWRVRIDMRRLVAPSSGEAALDQPHLLAISGDITASITVTPRLFNFRYRSAVHFIEVFRTWCRP